MFHFRETFLTLRFGKKSKTKKDNVLQKLLSRLLFPTKRESKSKIVWTFDLVEDLPRVPESYLKHLDNTDGLYEIRVQLGSDIFRIFCFFDQGQLVVLANGFQKKTQKTPKKEIEMALKIKAEYESEK